MFESVFKDVRGLKLNEYAKLFKSKTNKDYANYIEDQYTNNNMPARELATILDLPYEILRSHIEKYGIKKKEKVVDSNSLMNKTPSMIEKETGRKLIDIYNELADQGLSFTEIAIKLQFANVTSLSSYLRRYKLSQIVINEDDLVIKNLAGKKDSIINKMFLDQLGITYKEWLKQKYIDERMSPSEIHFITGINIYTLNKHIQRYELSKTNSEARQDAMKSGNIDYDVIMKKSRQTRQKNISRSNKQDLFRELIKHQLELLINTYPDIEIITGYNEYCILTNLEVDIPIIAINKDKVYKFALEYDGDVWHKDSKTDIEKERMLAVKNWILIRIEETSSSGTDMVLLESKAKDIVNKLIECINN